MSIVTVTDNIEKDIKSPNPFESGGTVSTTETQSIFGSLWIRNAKLETRKLEEMLQTEKNREIRFTLSKPDIHETKQNKLQHKIYSITVLVCIGCIVILLLVILNNVNNGDNQVDNEPFVSTNRAEIDKICSNFIVSDQVSIKEGFKAQFFVCIDSETFVLCDKVIETVSFSCSGLDVCQCGLGDFNDLRNISLKSFFDACFEIEEESLVCDLNLDDDIDIDLITFLNP